MGRHEVDHQKQRLVGRVAQLGLDRLLDTAGDVEAAGVLEASHQAQLGRQETVRGQRDRSIAGGSEALRERRTGAVVVGLTVRGTADAARAALADLTGVSILDASPQTTDCVDLRVELNEDRREDIVRVLVEAGLGIRRVEEDGDELEDILVALTRNATTPGGDR